MDKALASAGALVIIGGKGIEAKRQTGAEPAQGPVAEPAFGVLPAAKSDSLLWLLQSCVIIHCNDKKDFDHNRHCNHYSVFTVCRYNCLRFSRLTLFLINIK